MSPRYDYRIASSPLSELDTQEKVDGFKVVMRAFAWWMGMSTVAGIKNVPVVLKQHPYVQQWLSKHVNPSSETLYYGARWEKGEIPEVGSTLKRPRSGVLQWSRHEKTSRWFAGLLDGKLSEPDWIGGVLCEGKASSREILVDIDALSMFLGKYRSEFAALGPDSDSLGMFDGTQHEGEILTTGSVKARVIEARLF